MQPDRLVHMANQIGNFFKYQREAEIVPGIAGHIKKFWTRACARPYSLMWTKAAKGSIPW